MSKLSPGVSLDEVFAESEKDPRWAADYARADLEVRLALAISDARRKAKLTQGQLAKAIGTTQSVISRIEHGAQNLTLATLAKIAHALRCEVLVSLR